MKPIGNALWSAGVERGRDGRDGEREGGHLSSSQAGGTPQSKGMATISLRLSLSPLHTPHCSVSLQNVAS